MWSYLQQEEQREAMDSRCNHVAGAGGDCIIEFAPKCITFLVLSSAGSSMRPLCATLEL
jgi:hypothetical protein